MDVLYELGEPAPVEAIRLRLPDPPSNSAARAMLVRLEEKGHIRHAEKNLRYVYEPTTPQGRARDAALARIVRVFFSGSSSAAATALIDGAEDLPAEELERLDAAIQAARRPETRR